ncbi:hypothetical protein [uncultured Rhodoblastus sp.]|uniref:hypothetical protein n=1 Tax=uncultured Rhodoblastus sp. TaxID=543037 RepID=UPI0025E12D71|nr:hypothetical protein [uncultured Rhodoblastus sp.]
MTKCSSESTAALASRFRVLVNGFADRNGFPTLPHAVSAIPVKGAESLSFEIYDTFKRQFVWTRPKRLDGGFHPGAFSVRVNGHNNGLSFASLDDAADFISARPPGKQFAVFKNETCVFMAVFSGAPKCVKAS